MTVLLLALGLAHGTELIEAAWQGDLRQVQRLVDAGADPVEEARWRPPAKGFFGALFGGRARWTTPVHAATLRALRGDDRVLAWLLEEGRAPAQLATQDRPPPLHEVLAAASDGNRRAPGVARLLLERGADPRARYRDRPALHDAAAERDAGEALPKALAQTLDALVAAGLPRHEAACTAARRGDGALLAATLDPADIDRPCPEGTALVAAVQRGHVATAAQLLVAGADPDAQTRVGGQWLRPIHAAAVAGEAALVTVLAARGADPSGPSGPAWSAPTAPLAVALGSDLDAERLRVTLAALVGAGAHRAAATAEGTPFHHVGEDLPLEVLLGGRPLDPAEEGALVAAALTGPEVPLPEALNPVAPTLRGWLEDWGPASFAALYGAAGAEVVVELASAEDLGVCDLEPDTAVRELKRELGAPERGTGARIRSFTWDGVEATAWRDRATQRWTAIRVDGLPPGCTLAASLVDRPRAAAHLALGPPAAMLPDRDVWELDGMQLALHLEGTEVVRRELAFGAY